MCSSHEKSLRPDATCLFPRAILCCLKNHTVLGNATIKDSDEILTPSPPTKKKTVQTSSCVRPQTVHAHSHVALAQPVKLPLSEPPADSSSMKHQ